MLGGPSLDLYKRILKETAVNKTIIGSSGVEDIKVPGIRLIASGGISAYEDLPKLQEIGCEGAIIGKAIYENRIGLAELEQFILEA
jgi:phosphoribosylformimino-5-aminoimidazole carboxamide ribotide isomerase